MFLYQCNLCNKTFKRDEVTYLCPECSKDYKSGEPLKGVLKVVFDYDYIKKHFDKNNPDWNLFSAVEKKYYPGIPVGSTPYYKLHNLSVKTGFKNIWLKNDALNPSGSLKDRASFLVVAEANRLNINTIVTASTGNAASALACISASAEKKAIIFVPSSAPKAKLVQMYLYGAEVIKVEGTYDDAFQLSLEYSEKNSCLNRNTAYHPLTIEGKKSAGLEILFQNGYKVPDAILVPVGDGVIISGIYKAFYDLKMCGLADKLPKLICVQAEKSSAIHNFLTTGKYKNFQNPSTIADSISVSTPSNAYMAKQAVEESRGFSVCVSDEEILEGQKLLASTEGVFAEPAAASVIPALQKIKSKNLLNENEHIVLLITGNGLKDIETAMRNIKT